MQIEETFRDLKGHRWGFALRYARSHDPKRLQILLLVAALAALVVWLVGLAAHASNRHWRLQANTERRRPILSICFIGRQLLNHPTTQLPPLIVAEALTLLRQAILRALPV